MTLEGPVERSSTSPNTDRLRGLYDLFPEAFTEGQVDFDKLRAALGDVIDDRAERYSFTWAGKRDAIRLLQIPSRATLIPCRGESVNFDSTEHLFIEGDNLEVLKLLYKSYFGRVKMIYIDPPYNTGKDFIYPDNYADPLDTYLQITGQQDRAGNLLTSNPETSGRYHSVWLSMMYPRLFMARQMLRDDGIIFISIDDHEALGLRMILNEVFGEENLVAVFVRRRRMSTGMRGKPVSPDHEYIIAYAKASQHVRLFGQSRVESDYALVDETGKYRSTDLTVGMTRQMRPNQYYPIRNPRTNSEYWPPENRVWRFQPSTMADHIESNNIIWPDDSSGNLTRPRFKTRYHPKAGNTKPVSTWIDTKSHDIVTDGEDDDRINLMASMNQEGTRELRELFGDQVLEYPKPVSLIKTLCALSTTEDDIVLDFFAGSASTAQAIFDLNHEDENNRRVILVQLPEPIKNQQFQTIAEIAKDRMRRVISDMEQRAATTLFSQVAFSEDLGFKVFKLASSNFRNWAGLSEDSPSAYASQMEMYTDPLLEGWKTEDVVYEVAIREGYGLNCQIGPVPAIESNTIYRVSDPDREQFFLICLDGTLHPDTPRSLDLKKDDLFICRDVALDDELAANLALQCRLKVI